MPNVYEVPPSLVSRCIQKISLYPIVFIVDITRVSILILYFAKLGVTHVEHRANVGIF